MTSRAHMSHASELDSGSNSSGSDERNTSANQSGLALQTSVTHTPEHISRLRYHPRSSSSAVSSTSTSGSGLQPDPSRYGHEAYLFPDMSSETRRQNIMAMDRKRRLTGSTQEEGRRRQGPAGFAEHDSNPGRTFDNLSAVSRPLPNPHRRTSSQTPASLDNVDFTSSSLVRTNNPLPPIPPAHLSPTSSERVYVVPRWQPDSEVSECPICRRPFGFLFRRHHCRKCGRVVCNDCSPHRITIPRQYIVSPPGHESLSEADAREITDLSGDGDDEDHHNESNDNEEDTLYPSALNRRRRRARAHHMSLGGGEKVRLCNPCVPDPQPEHQPNYASHTLPFPSGFTRRSDPIVSNLPRLHQFAPPMPRAPVEPFPGMPTPNYIPAFNYQPSPRPYRNHATTFDSFGLPPSPLLPMPGSSYHAGHNYGRSGPPRDHAHIAHGRYHSFDQSRMGLHSTTRPRMRSMLEERNNFPRIVAAQGPPPRATQLREEDMCPICRGPLPSKGPDGDESAREAHIISCISSRDPTAPSLPSGSPGAASSPVRGPMHMLTFVATEKDCTSDDGGALECSICMVEYDVGEQLARLECLCKFHRECIVSWFERKQECPVHKIA